MLQWTRGITGRVEKRYTWVPHMWTTSDHDDKDAMSSKTFSIIVRCWYDQQVDATQLQVVRVDTAKNVRLGDGSFLLRISLDETAPLGRCFIRHLASGREAYVQGGPNLQAFIKDCLLNGSEAVNEPEQHDPGAV